MIDKLAVFKVLSNKERVSAIDIFRSIAILSVVLYHFNEFIPFGYLGVDLFFVISGFLIGRILIREFIKTNSLQYFRFILSRGFKIWPSYYTFLLLGNVAAYCLYHQTHPEYVIPLNDYARYLFFYKNFFGTQYHWCFEHVWSLCVEEHFYIIFPLLFPLLLLFRIKRISVKTSLFISVSATVILGIVLRYILLEYFSNSINAYENTLVRIDELAVGVLLGLTFIYYEEYLRRMKGLPYLFVAGFMIFICLIYLYRMADNSFYVKHLFPSLIPFTFIMMITGVYFVDFSGMTGLRIVAYFSYNWYLWHTVFVKFVSTQVSSGFAGLLIYLLISFSTAVFFTILIEETFLRYRIVFLNRFFPSAGKSIVE